MSFFTGWTMREIHPDSRESVLAAHWLQEHYYPQTPIGVLVRSTEVRSLANLLLMFYVETSQEEEGKA